MLDSKTHNQAIVRSTKGDDEELPVFYSGIVRLFGRFSKR